jgi:hypothetical protein
MNSKLTLKLNKTIIEKAKTYSKKNGVSLSKLVEHYFTLIVSEQKHQRNKLSRVVLELSGILELPENFDLKTERTNYLIDKYK